MEFLQTYKILQGVPSYRPVMWLEMERHTVIASGEIEKRVAELQSKGLVIRIQEIAAVEVAPATTAA